MVFHFSIVKILLLSQRHQKADMAANNAFYECRRCNPVDLFYTYEDLRAHLRARHSQRELDQGSIALYETYRGAYQDERALNRQSNEHRRIQRESNAIETIMATCREEFAGLTNLLREELRSEIQNAGLRFSERAARKFDDSLPQLVLAQVKEVSPAIVQTLLAQAIQSIGTVESNVSALASAVSSHDLTNVGGTPIDQPHASSFMDQPAVNVAEIQTSDAQSSAHGDDLRDKVETSASGSVVSVN